MRLFWFGFLFMVLQSAPSFAQSGHNFGAGIVIGDPTGLTAKYNFGRDSAFDAALSFSNGHYFYLHATYLFLRPKLFNIGRYPVIWYFGVGPRLINHDHDHYHRWHRRHDDDDHSDTHLAARAPLGLSLNFNDPRFEIFTEISIAMDVVPDIDADFDFGIGARYYF